MKTDCTQAGQKILVSGKMSYFGNDEESAPYMS